MPATDQTHHVEPTATERASRHVITVDGVGVLTAADLVDVLVTVPADASIEVSFASPSAAAAGHPDAQRAWSVTMTYHEPVERRPRPQNCLCAVEPVQVKPTPSCPTCGRTGDEPCVSSLSGEPFGDVHASRSRAHARGCTLDRNHEGACRPPFAAGGIRTRSPHEVGRIGDSRRQLADGDPIQVGPRTRDAIMHATSIHGSPENAERMRRNLGFGTVGEGQTIDGVSYSPR